MELFELAKLLPEPMCNEVFSCLNHQQRRALSGKYMPKKKSAFISLSSRVVADPVTIFAAMSERRENLPIEEILRNWLLNKKREMLKAALDFVKIPHSEGVTSNDLDAITMSPAVEFVKLVKNLKDAGFTFEEQIIYYCAIGGENYLRVKELREVVKSWGGEGNLPQYDEKEIVSIADEPKEETLAVEDKSEEAPAPAEEKAEEPAEEKKKPAKKSAKKAKEESEGDKPEVAEEAEKPKKKPAAKKAAKPKAEE